MITREEAIRFADTAAAAVLGTAGARTAGYAATFELSAGVLAQFLMQNPGAHGEALLSFALSRGASDAHKASAPKSWAKASKAARAAACTFAAVIAALESEVREHEALEDEKARAAAAAKPVREGAFGGRTFQARADGMSDRGGFLKRG